MPGISLKIDAKGRICLPLAVRKNLNINPGDVFFLNEEETGLHLAKAENPFDILAEDAIRQYKEGKTIDLRAFAKKHRIKLHDKR